MSKIRYAKILVISFITVALLGVLSLTFSILVNEKVFTTKISYRAKFSDATGLKGNVPVFFKGFKIGYVNKLVLSPDSYVYGDLYIYEEYKNIIKENCILYRNVNLITSITNILLLAGQDGSKVIQAGKTVPSFDTPEGKLLQRIHRIDYQGELLNSFMFKVESFLEELNPKTTVSGDSLESPLMKSFESLNASLGRMNSIISNVDETILIVKNGLSKSQNGMFGGLSRLDNLMGDLLSTTKNAQNLMTNLDGVLKNYGKPDSLAIKMIDPTGENLFKPVKTSLNSINELLPEINKLLVYSNDQTSNFSLLQEKIKKVLDDLTVTLGIINQNPLINLGTKVGNKKVDQGKKRPR
jgi:phospholipid/cholesterol/gamma-HCH transport system substrate-binding protein